MCIRDSHNAVVVKVVGSVATAARSPSSVFERKISGYGIVAIAVGAAQVVAKIRIIGCAQFGLRCPAHNEAAYADESPVCGIGIAVNLRRIGECSEIVVLPLSLIHIFRQEQNGF